MVQCNGPVAGRRKTFWVTQPDVCGTDALCDTPCGMPGLALYTPESAGSEFKTFRTNDYVRGLAINILFTDSRKDDTYCGHRPGARGGDWTDSFRSDGGTSGTNLRYLQPQKSVTDNVVMVREYIRNSLQKLVKYGVASSVEVTAKYIGGNVIRVTAEIIGVDGELSRVGVSGNRIANSWTWEQSDG